MNRNIRWSVFLLVALAFPLVSSAQWTEWRGQVGWTRLVAEYGAGLEDGTDVITGIIEAPDGNGNHLPDPAHGWLTGLTFINNSPGTSNTPTTGGHATFVAASFMGPPAGVADGVDNVLCYEANDYIGRALNFNTGGDPLADFFDSGNHSYIATGLDPAVALNVLHRLDFVINRDNSVHTVGLANNTAALPQLWCHSYNAVTVGRRDGTHSRGTTTLYGNGRVRPHIIGAQGQNSYTSPRVGGCAAVLREASRGTNADNNELIKALLFAGATKGEFPDWDRTTTRPIDDIFGFGELNIYHSYQILQGGEFDGAIAPAMNIGPYGWDFGTTDGTNEINYDFEITSPLGELSAALVWNIDITDSNASPAIFNSSSSLANLDLEILDGMGNLIDSSLGTVDNFEHLFLTNLGPGQYTMRITSDSVIDFGMAWRINEGAALGKKLLDGVATAGSLADASVSDDTNYALAPSPTTNPFKQKIDMIVISETTNGLPTSFGFCVEASMDGGPAGDVIQTIELFNETTGEWDLVDERPATTSDSSVLGAGSGTLSNYIHPSTGEIVARVSWKSEAFAGDPYFWTLDLDKAAFEIQ